jgi:hypothetical protein
MVLSGLRTSPGVRRIPRRLKIGGSKFFNVRFGPLYRLQSNISRGPRSANSGHWRRPKPGGARHAGCKEACGRPVRGRPLANYASSPGARLNGLFNLLLDGFQVKARAATTVSASSARRRVADSQHQTEKACFVPVQRLTFRVFPEGQHLDAEALAPASCARDGETRARVPRNASVAK